MSNSENQNLSFKQEKDSRPLHHFTPPQGWLNDPNGLVYYQGEYHLFYQHDPDSIKHGPMHWGHAVSTDLIQWKHLPIALYPDELGVIYSGSAVIDWHNTAGFGREAMIAIFTHHSPQITQYQSIAYSTDNGRTWTKYGGNPVLHPEKPTPDFRDPKVFWYGTAADGHWVMVLVAGLQILVYTSPDLKAWQFASRFAAPENAEENQWETPDLFALPLAGEADEVYWVLAAGVGSHAPAGGPGMRYFIGQFDGYTFTAEDGYDAPLWADYGPDFYAAQSWSDTADGRRIWIAWMSNWEYAQEVPTEGWRGGMTLPRELQLARTAAGVRLAQKPIAELGRYRGEHWSLSDATMTSGAKPFAHIEAEALEIVVAFQLTDKVTSGRVGLKVRVGDNEQTLIGYDLDDQTIFIDRTKSGQTDFSSHFGRIHKIPYRPKDKRFIWHILVDRTSVELLMNCGRFSLTTQIFPQASSTGVEFLLEDEGELYIEQLDIYQLQFSP